MKTGISLLAVVIFAIQCKPSLKIGKSKILDSINKSDLNQSVSENGTEAISVGEIKNDDYETAFIVVLDTSNQFHKMYELAMSVSRKFNIPFDTVQKSYFPQTNIWGVSQSSDDEIYRGEYFPRRNGSEKDILSLEYKYWYDKKGNDKNLMLVTNIFLFSMDAEKSVAAWRKYFPQAFIMQCDIYMGCIH
jgi:hypothetical protein